MNDQRAGWMEMFERLEPRTLLATFLFADLARAGDVVGPVADGSRGAVVLTTVRRAPGGPEALGDFASAPGQLLGASANSTGNVNIVTTNPAGAPIVFQQYAGPDLTAWTASDLQAKSGSPPITGGVITWVDPREDLNYAAAMTAEGLVLFHNTTAFGWVFRNLSTEVPGNPRSPAT